MGKHLVVSGQLVVEHMTVDENVERMNQLEALNTNQVDWFEAKSERKNRNFRFKPNLNASGTNKPASTKLIQTSKPSVLTILIFVNPKPESSWNLDASSIGSCKFVGNGCTFKLMLSANAKLFDGGKYVLSAKSV